MQLRRLVLLTQALCLAGPLAMAQQDANQAPPGPVIKAETRVVLVDAVVTDKKGEYVRDLSQKEFKVWEDNKQQEITSFSYEADPATPSKDHRRYLVLFFDNSTLDFGQQAQARKAAVQFIAANAGPNRLMAIVNYSGSLQISQNFTDDVERLKQVASGTKMSTVASNTTAASSGPDLSGAELSYGINTGILALKSLVKYLGSVPGRKSLVLLTGGFRLTPEILSDMTNLVDLCNKANVAVYPIDVRGLVAQNLLPGGPAMLHAWAYGAQPLFELASLNVPSVAFFQRGGTGGGTGAGGAGTGSSGGRGGGTTGSSGTGGGGKGGTTGSGSGGKGGTTGTTGTSSGRGGGSTTPLNQTNLNQLNNPMMNPRILLPTFPTDANTNQQPLYMLAQGTGGFVIVNTNDLLAGLEKIGKEQDQYYLIGYTPPESEEGSCHALKVKVDRGGTTVRARTGYCNVKPQDYLASNSVEKDLEKIAAGPAPGNITASMQVPFFYTSPTTVRADVALEIPIDALKFDKHKGKYHGAMNILGIAYKPDGTVAARFSDGIKLDFENKKELEAFQDRPSVHYEKEFEAAPGQYDLKVVLTSGQSIAKLEKPLNLDPGDSKSLRMSGLAFCRDYHRIVEGDTSVDELLTEDRTPLIANGMQFTPTGASQFKKAEKVAMYAQIYEGLMLKPDPPKDLYTVVDIRILDRKTKAVKDDSGMMKTGGVLTPGNSVVSIGLKVPLEKLETGSYVFEITVQDSAGNKVKREADFDVI